MKLEFYAIGYLGHSGWDIVKAMDSIWFSNIQRCADLIVRAYQDNPSLTMKELKDDDTYPEPFQAFANLVIRNS